MTRTPESIAAELGIECASELSADGKWKRIALKGHPMDGTPEYMKNMKARTDWEVRMRRWLVHPAEPTLPGLFQCAAELTFATAFKVAWLNRRVAKARAAHMQAVQAYFLPENVARRKAAAQIASDDVADARTEAVTPPVTVEAFHPTPIEPGAPIEPGELPTDALAGVPCVHGIKWALFGACPPCIKEWRASHSLAVAGTPSAVPDADGRAEAVG